MKGTRLLSLLLVLLMLAGTVSLAACKDNRPAGEITTPAQTSDNPAATTDPADTEAKPKVLDKEYDGYTFKILYASRSTRAPQDFIFQDNGTIMDKAVYDRNALLEEKNNILLDTKESYGNDHRGYEEIQQMNTANEPTYDFAVIHTYKMAPLATAGYLYDMSQVDSIDLENPWWDQTMTEGVRIAGSVLFTTCDFSHAVDDYMYCVIFNKELYRQKVTDGTDVYELVRQGTWTLDELARLASLVSEDLNADDKMDSNDRYGLLTWCDIMYASIQAGGERVAKVNEDGLVELTIQNERVNAIVDKFTSIEQSPYSINFQRMSGGVTWPEIFSNGNALFLTSLFNEVSSFRDMETDYGILPNPRYEATQDRWYCTFSAGLASVVAMPFVQEDPERTGEILELANYYSSKTTSPAYYTKTLVGEKIRDDESSFCLDIIFNNKFVDIGHYFQIASLNVEMYNYVQSQKSGAFASLISSKMRAANVIVDSLNRKIEDLKKLY